MFRKTLQWKIVFFICVIALCLVIPIGLLLNVNIENYHYSEFVGGIDKGFEAYDPLENKNPTVDSIYLDMSELYAGVFGIYGDNRSYTIVDIRDNTLRSSDYNYLNSDNDYFINDLYLSDNFIKAAAGEAGNDEKIVTISGSTFYDHAVKTGPFVFYFRYYKQDWQNMVSQFNRTIFTALAISLLIAFVFGFLISKAITNPIENITDKTRDIAEGNFGQILDKQGNDEIGQLTSSINYMSRSLRDMLDEIKNEKNKVDTILNNMTDGIIAFDSSGEIIHVNPGAMTFLNRVRLDENLEEFIREYRIEVTPEEILNKTEALNERKIILKLGDRIMRVGFAVFSETDQSREGCIVILRDVTEQHMLDNMQKEFVANVSHELKTPLTSIKSYTETLGSGMVEDKETERQFLSVIESEVNRMSDLVTDLLQLSALDMKRTKLDFRKYSVDELVEKTLEKLDIAAREKNHMLTSNVTYPGKAVFDYEKIQRVLINIVSNAIKYTEPGGKINVSAEKKDGNIVFTITDNGMGIPSKDLSRIFDRFYRVDKARSRKMGGTGLGLAIAREIISAHGGEIDIQSVENKGTEVTISIPLNSQWRNQDE